MGIRLRNAVALEHINRLDAVLFERKKERVEILETWKAGIKVYERK